MVIKVEITIMLVISCIAGGIALLPPCSAIAAAAATAVIMNC